MFQNQIPFDTYFQVEPLKEYTKVLTMETFMKEIAAELWPPGNRVGKLKRVNQHN